MPLDLEIEWVKLLINLINNNEIISQYLEVTNNIVNFKKTITEEVKKTIRKDISDNIIAIPHYYRKIDDVN